MMKKILLLLYIFVILGCTKKNDSNTIKVWTFWKKQFFEDTFKKFQKKYPQYKIEYQQLTWSNGFDKIVTTVAADYLPDVVELGSTWTSQFIKNNIIQSIDNKYDIKNDYVSGLESIYYKNKYYGFPMFASVNIIFYNKDLFKKAGVKTVPKTWDDLLNVSEKINKLDKDIFGFSIKILGKYTTWQKFLPFLWVNNGKIMTSDYKKVLINSAEFKDTIKFYKKLSKSSLIGQQDAVRQAFYLGKIGMIYDGAGFNIKKNAPNIKTGSFILPHPNNSKFKSSGFAGADYLCVFTKNQMKKKAAEELAYEMSLNYSISKKIKSLLPLYMNNIQIHLKENPDLKTYIEQLKYAKSPVSYPKWEFLMEKLNLFVETVLLNKKTINNAILYYQNEMQKILDEK